MQLLHLIIRQLMIAVAFLGAASTDHLVPDADDMKDEYGVKLHFVFAEAYREGVTLRALYVPSFVNEFAVGIRPGTKTGDMEVFLLEPTSSVWTTEVLRLYESGEIRASGPDGKPIPLEKNRSYQKLKKRSPPDYRKISIRVRTRAIPPALANRVRTVWVAMLRGVKPDEGDRLGTDGETYHISAPLNGRQVSGSVWSPEETGMPKTWNLARLVDRLSEYARGSVDETALTNAVQEAEKVIPSD